MASLSIPNTLLGSIELVCVLAYRFSAVCCLHRRDYLPALQA